MMPLRQLTLVLFIFLMSATTLHAASFYYSNSDQVDEVIKVCVDNNYWFPYTFSHKGKPVGLHADVADTAFHQLELKRKYHLAAWETCINEVKSGESDAVLSVSYTPERKKFIRYPEGVDKDSVSPWRLGQVVYYAATSLKNPRGEINPYFFRGKLASLPQPIRIEQGYSVASLFEALEFKLEYNQTSIDNFKALVAARNGTVIATHETITSLKKQPIFKNSIQIHSAPVTSKSYFIGFSHDGVVSRKVQRKIWKQVRAVRRNQALMIQFLNRYGFDR